MSKLDAADGSLEFIGEDRIDHTPKDEEVRIKLGSAFDVVGERRQTDFSVDSRAQWMEEQIEIKLRNHKQQPVQVLVKENLYRWSNWKILTKTHEFTKEDAARVVPLIVAVSQAAYAFAPAVFGLLREISPSASSPDSATIFLRSAATMMGGSGP